MKERHCETETAKERDIERQRELQGNNVCGSCTVWQEDSAGPVSLQAKEGLAPLQAQLDGGADPFAAVTVPGKASVQFNLGHQDFHASAELMAGRMGAEITQQAMEGVRSGP